MAVRKSSRFGSRGNPEVSREAILRAAVEEFAKFGIAGARTDHIAAASGLNKALMYYYYGDKEGLYQAVLEYVFSGLAAKLTQVLERDIPSLQKLQLYTATHFDFIAEHPTYPRIFQGEMARSPGVSPRIRALAQKIIRPLYERLGQTIVEGIRKGELRADLDPANVIISMGGLVGLYFVSAPVAKAVTGKDPLSPAALRARRAAVVDHITAILRP